MFGDCELDDGIGVRIIERICPLSIASNSLYSPGVSLFLATLAVCTHLCASVLQSWGREMQSDNFSSRRGRQAAECVDLQPHTGQAI